MSRPVSRTRPASEREDGVVTGRFMGGLPSYRPRAVLRVGGDRAACRDGPVSTAGAVLPGSGAQPGNR
jgi:hypothetical protein